VSHTPLEFNLHSISILKEAGKFAAPLKSGLASKGTVEQMQNAWKAAVLVNWDSVTSYSIFNFWDLELTIPCGCNVVSVVVVGFCRRGRLLQMRGYK